MFITNKNLQYNFVVFIIIDFYFMLNKFIEIKLISFIFFGSHEKLESMRSCGEHRILNLYLIEDSEKREIQQVKAALRT